MLNQNTQQEASKPLAECGALTKSTTPLQCDMQEETGQAAKKGNLSDAVSNAVAEVLASRFVKAIIGMALGGIVSEDAVHSASAVEARDHAQSVSVSSSGAAAHPHTCGRQTLPELHSYERD